jgi:signal transduction histidine kinase
MPEGASLRRVATGPHADGLLFAGFALAGLAEQLGRPDADDSPRALAWIVALSCPLLVRRSHPVLATGLTAALILAVPDLSGFPPALFKAVLPVVLSYACGAYAERLPGVAAVLMLSAAVQVHMGFADAPNLEILIGTLPPWWAGSEVRRRRLLVRQLADRTHELEAEEESFVRLSVQRERARIARDLHDIVSHHLAVMVVQAGAGRLAEPWDASVAAGRFGAIREAGIEALAEADRLVSILHRGRGGHRRLAPLLDQARELGALVIVTPPDLVLAPRLEEAAHHITREALTNALKHAPGAPLEIRMELSRDELTITAHNATAEAASPLAATGSRLGLTGMRDRVEALGGTFAAGPDPHGGFSLRACLPPTPPPELAAAAG